MATAFSIRIAARIVRRGGVIAYATDTLYGLGCDPYNPDAIERIYQIKHRPPSKHNILLASNLQQLEGLIAVNDEQADTMLDTQVPTSWIVPAADTAPRWLQDRNGDITVRISRHANVAPLCNALGHAIISTSANISGKPPVTSPLMLHHYFHQTVDRILLAGEAMTCKPSKVIRLCDNHIFRN